MQGNLLVVFAPARAVGAGGKAPRKEELQELAHVDKGNIAI